MKQDSLHAHALLSCLQVVSLLEFSSYKRDSLHTYPPSRLVFGEDESSLFTEGEAAGVGEQCTDRSLPAR